MKTIPLTQDLVAIVDDADYETLSQFKWHAKKHACSAYAARNIRVDGKQRTLKMHRVIMGDDATGLHVDHRDGDGLNNQRGNLRICTRSENNRNRRLNKDNVTGLKGVSAPKTMRESVNKFAAQIRVNGKCHHLGHFSTAELAHAAYCAAAVRFHGEFASFK